jgi:hypothetical protein
LRKHWNTTETERKTLEYFIRNRQLEQLGCADPRDRVFGLLGLVEELETGSMGIVKADYPKSKEDIYCHVLCFLKRRADFLLATSNLTLMEGEISTEIIVLGDVMKLLERVLRLKAVEGNSRRRLEMVRVFLLCDIPDDWIREDVIQRIAKGLYAPHLEALEAEQFGSAAEEFEKN